MLSIAIKRVYELPEESDGYRVLVDRLWPRGVMKEKARLDGWWKELTPSTELRQWFGHRPERYGEFSRRYRAELDESSERIAERLAMVEGDRLTLVFAAADPVNNHARVLASVLDAARRV